jgi:hypothetical protein
MAIIGLVYVILLFLFCFVAVIIIKLALIGLQSLNKKPPQKEQPSDKKAQPVYYIVERKRTKKKYSEPKEIEFK